METASPFLDRRGKNVARARFDHTICRGTDSIAAPSACIYSNYFATGFESREYMRCGKIAIFQLIMLSLNKINCRGEIGLYLDKRIIRRVLCAVLVFAARYKLHILSRYSFELLTVNTIIIELN